VVHWQCRLCKAMVFIGGSRFDPHGPHKHLKPTTITIKWGAMWQPMPGPRGTKPLDKKMPRVSSWFAELSTQHMPHVVWPCQFSPVTCHTTLPRHHTDMPCQHPYELYSQHIFFCLFDESNRSWYLTHPISVWTQTSCVGFVMTRATHLFVLRQFQELWFFS